ncbi:MAG: type II toxin-antitoxin system HicB family antitoxin [Deltaproteobacteria bacterium]|jgi:predicted HicB family RNase H-like nuclease|nr:type II toxin-antitoxin system HicB family antitoxin [Deltaproteobacteria bacterium]
MKPMTHRGYVARLEYNDEEENFVGRIVGIQDIITFQGDSVAQLRRAFVDAVDIYLDSRAKSGREPQKPYSGRLTLRLPPELHANLAIKAEVEGKSLNNLIVEALRQASEN